MKEYVIEYIDKVIEYYSTSVNNTKIWEESSKLETKLEEYIEHYRIDLIHDLAVSAHYCNRTHQDIYKAYSAFGFDDLDSLIEVE